MIVFKKKTIFHVQYTPFYVNQTRVLSLPLQAQYPIIKKVKDKQIMRLTLTMFRKRGTSSREQMLCSGAGITAGFVSPSFRLSIPHSQ